MPDKYFINVEQDDPYFVKPGPEKPSKLTSITTGAREGMGDLKGFLDLLKPQTRLDQASPLLSAAARIVSGTGRQLLEGAKAVPDVARNLINPETRQATVQGFKEGATEGATGATLEDTKRDPLRTTARVMVNTVLPALIPGAPKAVRGVLRQRGARSAAQAASRAEAETVARGLAGDVPDAVVARGLAEGPKPRDVTGLRPSTPQTFEQTAIDALEELRQPSKPAGVSLPPPAAQPPVTFKAPPPAKIRLKTEAPSVPAAEPPSGAPFSAPETRLPAGWRPVDPTKLKLTGLTSDDLARFQAAEGRAPVMTQQVKDWMAKRFKGREVTRDEMISAAVEDWGRRRTARAFGLKYDDLVQQFPESRLPNLAQEAIAEYDRRSLINERGFADPKLLAKIGLPVGGAAIGGAMADDDQGLAGATIGGLAGLAAANPIKAAKGLQAARVTGMLSGAALPKSLAGNLGSFLTAAAERGSLAPIKEALRVPTNLKNAAVGWKGGANPAGIEGMNRINVPGRIMGALDESSTQALQRAGLSLEEAQRLLLTKPNPLGKEAGAALSSPVGRMAFPFQRTPFNAGLEGIRELSGLMPKSGASNTRRALTVGAGAAGAAAGSETDNKYLLALLAALAGPRGVPFALGAGMTAGPRVIEQMGIGFPEGSWRDMLDPLRPIDRPALVRLLEEAGGR